MKKIDHFLRETATEIFSAITGKPEQPVITPSDAVALLNSAFETDPEVMKTLSLTRYTCNEKLADHPTIQVLWEKDKMLNPEVGMIGILNGIFGIREDGMGHVCTKLENNQMRGFMLTPRRPE